MRKTLAMFGTASVLAIAAASVAQAGTIAGRVTDGSQSIGLTGAVVRVLETGQTATVQRDGTFRIAGLPAGEYTLRVTYVGAEPAEMSVTLTSDNDTVSPTIAIGDDVSYRENILVVGQRGALNSALSRQRSAEGNIVVLTSDAIGQFPDENVAEAARRAVGVNVLNDQGEGRFVSIRGIDPNLVSTTVNGVRLASPEAEDRQVGLDVIDADALSSVVINKSLTPDMDGDTVGGNVEIETASGLSVDEMSLRARTAVLYNDLESAFGWRASVNYADNFMDGRLGVAASLSYQERQFGSESYEVDGGWETGEAVPFPNEVEMRNYEITRERTTATLNLDYQYSNELSFWFRNTYSDFSDQEYRSRVEVKLEDADFNDAASTGNFASFIANDMDIDRDIKDRLETQEIFASDLGGEWLRGNTTIDWSLTYVHAEEAEPNRLDTDFGATFENGEAFGINVANPIRPVLAYGPVSEVSAFDPDNYENAGFEFTNGLAQDREYAANINARHDLTFGNIPGFIQYGLRARSRDKKFSLDMEVYDDASNLTLAPFAREVDYSQDRQGPVPDPTAVRNWFNANRGTLDLEVNDSIIESLGASYKVEEDVTAAYLMGNIENGPISITGGIRIEQTDVTANGNEVFLAEEDSIVNGIVLDDDYLFVTPVTVSDDYTDVLPSVLARFQVAENWVARAAYYESIQRPNPGQFAPRILLEQNDSNELQGEFGNPDLERLEAENFDFSLEWYPNNDSVVYVGYFHKDLTNFIGDVQYSNTTINGRLFDEANTFINLPSAEVSGWEFNYQQALDFLPVEGFIVGFNYTAADSDAVTADGRAIPLPRQSDEVWSTVLGYDQGPWDLRAVWTSRSEYLDEIRGDASEDRYVQDHTQLDLSAKFNFNDRLQIFGDIKNVTDEPFLAVTRPDGVDRVEQLEEYGWSTVFGIRVTY